jgi:thiosulfate dehydrogenase
MGCGPTSALEWGKETFEDPRFSTAASNNFSCATCHDRDAPTRVTPGYTLADVDARANLWGGGEATMLDAVNECMTAFMKSRPIDPMDDQGRALFYYLVNLRDGRFGEPIPLTVVQNIVDVPSGDATRGQTAYGNGCKTCHGEPSTGAGRIGPEASLIPDETVQMHGTDPTTGARPVTIEKVRHGKFFNVGGVMAPYSLEALSDAGLGDILAYLETFGLPKSQ